MNNIKLEAQTCDRNRRWLQRFVRPQMKIKHLIFSNLALGRGFSDREREVVERSSAKRLRESLPTLLGLKRKQAPILHLLED